MCNDYRDRIPLDALRDAFPGLETPGGAPNLMFTTEPGPDVVPIHPRQIVVLGPGDWARWLDGPEQEALLRPSSAGSLTVERLG